MPNQRRTIVLITSVIVSAVIVLLVVHPWVRQAAVKQYHPGETVSYTDAVTGTANNDIPGEFAGQVAGLMVSPGATVSGLEGLRSYLTDAQYLNISNTLSNFLLAHSGGSTVTAGIKQDAVTQSNNTITFTLVADRPQAQYSVTIDTSNSQNPGITIEEKE